MGGSGGAKLVVNQLTQSTITFNNESTNQIKLRGQWDEELNWFDWKPFGGGVTAGETGTRFLTADAVKAVAVDLAFLLPPFLPLLPHLILHTPLQIRHLLPLEFQHLQQHQSLNNFVSNHSNNRVDNDILG